MTKLLVTGGAGFIGAHLTNQLIKKKHKVLVVDNLTTIGGIKFIHKKCTFIKGDLLDEKTLKKIKSWKPKIIFHTAAQSAGESAYDNPKHDFLSNGFATFNLCKVAKEIKVKHFIYTSSVAVYGSYAQKTINEKDKISPDSIYGVSKYSGEMFVDQVLNKTSTKTTIYRLSNIYGPGENLNYMKKGMVKIYSSYIWKKKPIIVKGSKKRVRTITFIDDCINILSDTINNQYLKKNEILNLSSGKYFTVKELIKEILLVNKNPSYKIIEKKGTLGDSFKLKISNKNLKKRFRKLKFTPIRIGLKKYFEWINKIPLSKKLEKYHPLKKV